MTRPATNRGGRPIKQPNEKRCLQVNLRLTIAEFDIAKAQADRAGITVAEFIRRAMLNTKIVAPAAKSYARLTYEINRLGNNANQISRRLNCGSPYKAAWDYVARLCARTLEDVANDR